MVAQELLDETAAAVETSGLLRNLRQIGESAGNGRAELLGEVDIDGTEVTLRIVLDAPFPLRLPTVFMDPPDVLGFIPHVNRWGHVCFMDPEGLVLDQSRPGQIAVDSLEKAIAVLAAGVREENLSDFADEFDIYWSSLPDGVAVMSVLEPEDQVREVVLAFSNDTLMWVAQSERNMAAYLNLDRLAAKHSLQNGLYLPLEPGTVIVPPRSNQPFWDAEEARQVLIPNLSEFNRSRLERLIRSKPRVKEYVFVRLPRPSGGYSLFGLRYEQIGAKHPLKVGGQAGKLTPLYPLRYDRNYLMVRGGSAPNISEKPVLLVGCGAVGGYLALELARAGLLNLTLVDDDDFEIENTFRHVLGQRYRGKNKAIALKTEIEEQLPYVRVRAIPKSIETAITAGEIDLNEFALVVIAIGSPTVELMLNSRLHAVSDGPAGVFTWLEPLGIGGHALLTNNNNHIGCFECLFSPVANDGERLVNRSAFAAPHQSFGRALSGCGSLHTPYGSLDAIRTANLAARLVLDALTGKERGNPLLSWKGDAETFETAGFRLSTRFSASQDELDLQRYSYVSAFCPVCGEDVMTRSERDAH